ncbi:uncharacterized protein PHACADRAFT_59508, partial [Phanerochaete carnosa HHB-10118-sp]
FIHASARPHPDQVEVARNNIRAFLEDSQVALKCKDQVHITDDEGELHQDRYPLRTLAQFLDPQIDDILGALDAVMLECNSNKSFSPSTDNPLVDGKTGTVHHGDSFQAVA